MSTPRIFPEDVDVPLETVALLWRRTGGLDDVDTETCLQTFFTMSLVLDFNLGTRRIRIHDVIRRYLTDEIETEELQRIHGELVAAYRDRCGGDWSKGVDDYFFRSTGAKIVETDHGLTDAALAPGGRRALLCHDLVATLWNLETGQKECSFQADATARGVACPSDTSFLVCSDDGRVHALDLRD